MWAARHETALIAASTQQAERSTLMREHGFSRDVIELLLARAEINKAAGAYDHHELVDERRRASSVMSAVRIASSWAPRNSTRRSARDVHETQELGHHA